jgi:Rrf2 family protein
MGNLDAKTRYALLAALDLAEHSSEDAPAKVREIAARTHTPEKYLVHILLRLKRRALVNSTRGARGGYWLVRPARLISAAEVIGAVQSANGKPADRQNGSPYDSVVERLEEEAEEKRTRFLADVSLADMLRRRGARG